MKAQISVQLLVLFAAFISFVLIYLQLINELNNQTVLHFEQMNTRLERTSGCMVLQLLGIKSSLGIIQLDLNKKGFDFECDWGNYAGEGANVKRREREFR